MKPLGTRGRAADFSRRLDGVLAGPGLSAAGGGDPYLTLAGRLRATGAVLAPPAPRPEFRAALRTRLLAVASVQAASGPAAAPSAALPAGLRAAVRWTQGRPAQRGIGLVAGALAGVVAVTGVAVAGSQSLPGDPFYGLKRGTEALELRFAGGPVGQGAKHLEFAVARLDEVRALTLGRRAAAFGGPPGQPLADAIGFGGPLSQRVRDTLADMDRQTREGSSLLTTAYRDSHRNAPIEILSRFAGQQTRDLQALLPALPATARPSAEASLSLVRGVGVQANELLAVGVCSAQCAPTQSAPTLPPVFIPGQQPGLSGTPPCGCEPVPAATSTGTPAPTPTPTGGSRSPATAPDPSPSPSRSASPTPSASQPPPAPLPSPLPLPTLPVPLPSSTVLRLPDLLGPAPLAAAPHG